MVPVAALRANLPDLTEAGNRTYILRIARGLPSEGRGRVGKAFILGSGRMGETPVMRPLAAFIGLIFALLAAGPAAAASNDLALATFPPAGRLDYTVVREGDDIGTQSVEFIRSGDRLTVRTHVNILVTVLGIPVFRFTHESEEQWQNGRLTAFKSKSNDDGEPRDVALRLDGDRLRGLAPVTIAVFLSDMHTPLFAKTQISRVEGTRGPGRSILDGRRDGARAASDICALIPKWGGR